MQFLKYKSTRDAITRPLGNTLWIAHQYLLLLYDTKARFIHSLPKLPRMCTLNTAVVEKRWIIKLGLLGLSLWFDSSCLTFTKSVIGVLGKKMGPKGRRSSQWHDLTQRKQIALSDSKICRSRWQGMSHLDWTCVCHWDESQSVRGLAFKSGQHAQCGHQEVSDLWNRAEMDQNQNRKQQLGSRSKQTINL